MPKPTKYILLSLPQRIFDTSADDAISSLSSTVPSDSGTVLPFSVPSFKIGTLDALVGQADDLAKLDTACEGVVSKVAESLKSILDGDDNKLDQQKMVNDSESYRPFLPNTTILISAQSRRTTTLATSTGIKFGIGQTGR
jgi:V-type H+-transporting ATPase subunit C